MHIQILVDGKVIYEASVEKSDEERLFHRKEGEYLRTLEEWMRLTGIPNVEPPAQFMARDVRHRRVQDVQLPATSVHEEESEKITREELEELEEEEVPIPYAALDVRIANLDKLAMDMKAAEMELWNKKHGPWQQEAAEKYDKARVAYQEDWKDIHDFLELLGLKLSTTKDEVGIYHHRYVKDESNAS